MNWHIVQLPVFADNYIYLIHEPRSGTTAAVDPAAAEPVLNELARRGWTLTHVFNTHHHWDHVDGNLALKSQTGCQIFASAQERTRIPGIDCVLEAPTHFTFGALRVEVLAVPGHTLGHIAFYFPQQRALFCGDTLFAMGCGRLFEGTSQMMWQSLQQIRQLPADCQIYCAHEYTQQNGRFALSLEPDNAALRERMTQVTALRAQNQPTVPSRLSEELATNPFLRWDAPALQHALGMVGADPVAIFAETRRRKDHFA